MGLPKPVEPSVNRMDALGEETARTLNMIETTSDEDARTTMPPGAPGSVAGAENASAPRQESLTDLVHRLRTPLNAALLWVRLVRAGGLEPHSRERALETIEQNLCRLNQLLGDLVGETGSGEAVRRTPPTSGHGEM
jgi:signal transduction histidine kinase